MALDSTIDIPATSMSVETYPDTALRAITKYQQPISLGSSVRMEGVMLINYHSERKPRKKPGLKTGLHHPKTIIFL